MDTAARATRAVDRVARSDLATLARQAALGDTGAWPALVHRLDGMLHCVVRRYRLAPADVEDVVQTTWLRAIMHLGRLHDPAAIGPWLTVTARREAIRLLQRRSREVLANDIDGRPDAADPDPPDTVAIDRERHAALHRAVERLPSRQRRLVCSLLSHPSRSYEELSSSLDMPIGSIGPTRE